MNLGLDYPKDKIAETSREEQSTGHSIGVHKDRITIYLNPKSLRNVTENMPSSWPKWQRG